MSDEKFNNQGGANQNFGGSNSNSGGPDELGTPMTILSFCIPIVGGILYATNKDQFPNKAKTAGRAAIAGLVLGLILNIIARVAMS
jgi:hypothetical protein